MTVKFEFVLHCCLIFMLSYLSTYRRVHLKFHWVQWWSSHSPTNCLCKCQLFHSFGCTFWNLAPPSYECSSFNSGEFRQPGFWSKCLILMVYATDLCGLCQWHTYLFYINLTVQLNCPQEIAKKKGKSISEEPKLSKKQQEAKANQLKREGEIRTKCKLVSSPLILYLVILTLSIEKSIMKKLEETFIFVHYIHLHYFPIDLKYFNVFLFCEWF